MTTITIYELEARVREVIFGLAHSGEAFAGTLDGAVVATLTPVGEASGVRGDDEGPGMSEEEVDAFWAPWRRVWDAIGDEWPEGVPAVDAVREQRRG